MKLLITAVIASLTISFLPLSAQAPAFDVVSIKPTPRREGVAGLNSTWTQRPDGSLTATNVSISTLIARAYEASIPGGTADLPAWARTERYDVSATSTLSKATLEERAAMIRAMLADRFKLIAHVERREQPAYDLLLARSDGKLGPGVMPSGLDCVPVQAERAAAAEAAR